MKNTFTEVLTAVRDYYDIAPVQLFAVSRKREIVEKRMVFIYLCFTESEKFKIPKLQEFIQENGRGDYLTHATVIHSKKTIENFCAVDPRFRKEIFELRQIINTKIPMVVRDVDLLNICRSYSTSILRS